MIPILWAVLLAAAPGPAAVEGDSCTVSEITWEKLWELPEECRFSDTAEDPKIRAAIKVQVKVDGPLISGESASVTVTLRNRSKHPVELAFWAGCDGPPLKEEKFSLDIDDQRGRAPVQGRYGMVGVLFPLKACDNPYVAVVLRPGGSLETTIPFFAAAQPPMEGWEGGARPQKSYEGRPTLPEGPLRPGAYVLRVSVSLEGKLKLSGETKVRVK